MIGLRERRESVDATYVSAFGIRDGWVPIIRGDEFQIL
jgi:hypothetical protein